MVDGELRGLGRLEPLAGSSPRAAEAALSVERPHQNRGVGTALLRRLITAARNRSIEMLFMLCLLENGRVLRLARKLGATLVFDRREGEARLALPWPNHMTVLLELLDETEALLAVLRRAESVPTVRQDTGPDAAAGSRRTAGSAAARGSRRRRRPTADDGSDGAPIAALGAR